MRTIRGKRVLITGAAAGIGQSLARAFAREGADLVLVDRDAAGLEAVAGEARSHGVTVDLFVVDLTDPSQITRMVQRTLSGGPVDILVNNAGVAYYGPTEKMTQEQWEWLMAINLQAPIRITRELLPTLLSRPEPHIVNICSIASIVAGARNAAYHTSKFALLGFTEALRADYGRRGMGVSAICPGPVRTDLYRSAASGRSDRGVPEPPAIMTATPESVAAKTIRAVKWNRRLTLITATAHGLFQLKRFAPWAIDFANQFSRKKLRRRREARRLMREEQQRRAA